MAGETGIIYNKQQEQVMNRMSFMTRLLRVIAFLATLTATILMAVDKQHVTIVVGKVGNTLIAKTLTAKFQNDPAYIFFVIANAIGSLHNLVMLVADFCGNKFDLNGIRHTMVPIFDVVGLVVVATGASGAAFVGGIAENGESSARWEEICDTFSIFCKRAIGAVAVSYVGLITMFIIIAISIVKLKYRNIVSTVVP